MKWINDLRNSSGGFLEKHFLNIDTCVHGPTFWGDTLRTVAHLHGAHTRPYSDGYPDYTQRPGEYQLAEYPNPQAAQQMWYHDHALGITRLNVYAGLVGLYMVRDAAEAALNLPAGEYEVPLVIVDRVDEPHNNFIPVEEPTLPRRLALWLHQECAWGGGRRGRTCLG